jgi:phosphate-selective porin
VGTAGLFQPGLLLQGWYLIDDGARTTSTFRLRRAEIHAKGEIIPGLVSYAVMIDPARAPEFGSVTVPVDNQDLSPAAGSDPESVKVKQPPGNTSILQDVFVTFQSEYLDASIGQFKIPVSWEGYTSSSKIVFPERALSSQMFGDKRDMGIRLAKQFKYVGYSAGVFNGAGQNNLDTNNAKDLALRLEAYPIEGLTVAGVIYGSVGRRVERDGGTASPAKARYEGDLRFERGPFLFQGEYIRGIDVAAGGDRHVAQGFYTLVGWTLLGRIQPVLRVGAVDPDVNQRIDADNYASVGKRDQAWHYDVGVNYYFQKHEAKLQLAYTRTDNKHPELAPDSDTVIFAAQVAF